MYRSCSRAWVWGLQKFRNGRYDVVPADVQMPGMDGHTATDAELCLAAITCRAALDTGDDRAACQQVEADSLPALSELTDAAALKTAQSV